jgi:hypothetical protein
VDHAGCLVGARRAGWVVPRRVPGHKNRTNVIRIISRENPRADFDPVHRKRFIRLCYAGAMADVTEAVERLAAQLNGGELQNSASSSDTSSGSFMAASIHSRMWGISMMASQ